MQVIRLKTVVFPAPFGPIMLTISLGQTCRSRSCTAARPPKYLVTLYSSSRGPPVCSPTCSTFIANSCLPLLKYAPRIRNPARLAQHLMHLPPPAHQRLHAIRAVYAHWVSALR